MSTPIAIAAVLLALAAVNVWVHVGPRRIHVLTGPLAALGLLGIGRLAGLSWEQLGLGSGTIARGVLYGVVAACVVAVVYAAALAIPWAHRFFKDERYQVGTVAASTMALLTIPLGTVLFEEVAFRGVLWGLLEGEYGTTCAVVVTSVLFGLWHVLPALDLARTSTALASTKVLRTVLGTVAFTTAAGLVFAYLRASSGSLLAPALFHWAVNALGVLAAARVWALSQAGAPPHGDSPVVPRQPRRRRAASESRPGRTPPG